MRWACGYGQYKAEGQLFSYVVTLQRRRGELMWFALARPKDDECDCSLEEVPGPLPLNRRQAMKNCEEHEKEFQDY